MHRLFGAIVAMLIATWGGHALASITINVDAAPNIYGSPNYAAWEAAAFSAVSGGTFVNMGNSVNPANAGTTNFEIEDVVVYSFGDLGRRLSWIYWIPGETVASLTGRFQISLLFDWDGVTYDAYKDYYGSTWLQPGSWQNYAGGVIGVAGWAWWGAYNTNTQAELDADLAAWGPSQGNFTFRTRILDAAGATVQSASLVSTVPEPGTLALLVLGVLGIRAVRRDD